MSRPARARAERGTPFPAAGAREWRGEWNEGVVGVSAAAGVAVPRLLDCAPRGQDLVSRGELLVLAHVVLAGVERVLAVVAVGGLWSVRTLLLCEYELVRSLALA